jgi:sugar phosphate isomerase/epimerase
MSSIDHSRRNLLKAAGAGAVALTIPRFNLFAEPRHKAKIGLQLYTIRKQIEKDFEGTLRKVAEIGFAGIETYALPGNITLEAAAKVFNDAGLTIIGMHTELPAGDKRDAVLKMADVYKCDLAIYPGWPQGDKYRDVDATKHMVGVYDEASAFLGSKGLRFGLHNHWWEFEKADGIYPFYYLLDHASGDIVFEIDTYWARTGGQNPATVLKRFGKRAPLLHIKDGPAIKGDRAYAQVPAGDGAMDFRSIVKAGGKNIQWMIVEFDEYDKDIFDGIRKSYSFLTRHGLAEGTV